MDIPATPAVVGAGRESPFSVRVAYPGAEPLVTVSVLVLLASSVPTVSVEGAAATPTKEKVAPLRSKVPLSVQRP